MPLHPRDPIQILRQEFRSQLEQFYTHLHLAPPYHSIEKAVQNLSNTLRTKPEEFHEELLENATKKWNFFQKIFVATGLHKKHRGIILQLVRSPKYSIRSNESLQFLEIFTAPIKNKGNPAPTS